LHLVSRQSATTAPLKQRAGTRNATALAVDWSRNVKLTVPACKPADALILEHRLERSLQSLGGE